MMDAKRFSIIANLTELESFILHDSTTQALYQQYLALEFPSSRKANNMRFYADMATLGSPPQQVDPQYVLAELYMMYERYFLMQSELLLDIPHEKLEQVRHNVAKNMCLVAFKPAIKAVVKDLVFIHLDSFLNSSIFKEYKDSQLAGFDLSDVPEGTVQEKERILKLRRFFGEKDVQGNRKVLRRDQPTHIKEYKLSKIFGERVGVEKTALLEREQEPGTDSSKRKKRDRRLHVFFGNNFSVEETLYSERVRSRSFSAFSDLCEFRKQPTHVQSFHLAKFFGARPPVADNKQCRKSIFSTDDVSVTRHHSKTQHLMRFFGEHIDPVKEATHASFASQPANVKGCTLKKFFGESAAHTIKFDCGTWPRSSRNVKSKAKLEKIFGPFEA